MIPIARPSIGDEELTLLDEVLASGWLTHGPKVAEFERRFAERHDVPHAMAVTSCTMGLYVILKALEIGPGDEVIVPSFTWAATVNAVVHVGAIPVLVDVDRNTFNITPETVAEKLTERTRAVIAVHLFGLCVDIDALADVLPEDVLVIEDAACAVGARYKGRSAGALGTAAAFSFHPRKVVTTGEGGMITTQDETLAKRIEMIRNHGAAVSEETRERRPRPHELPEFPLCGINARMSDLQGAVGLAQLRKLDGFIAERAAQASFYRQQLSELNWLRLPEEPEGGVHGWQAFVAYVDPDAAPLDAWSIMDEMERCGIATRPGTHAVHCLRYYGDAFGYRPDDLPAARDCAANTLALPLHNTMSDGDCRRVVDVLRSI